VDHVRAAAGPTGLHARKAIVDLEASHALHSRLAVLSQECLQQRQQLFAGIQESKMRLFYDKGRAWVVLSAYRSSSSSRM
jgi:hypothetical protein